MAYLVLTRDLDGAAAYTEALSPLGLELVAMPVTHTVPAHDDTALVRALDAGGYTAIVIASARAAHALAVSRGHAPLPEVWAVGPATARALAEAGIPAIHPASALDGVSLAHALVDQRAVSGRRVLVPRAEDGRDELSAILRAAGVLVDDVVAYRTVTTPADDPELVRGRELLAGKDAVVCAVFAPSQVAALAALVGPLGERSAMFAAIGATTAAALREAGVETVGVAETPTPEGLANAIAAVYPRR